jgi:hypothetical protein
MVIAGGPPAWAGAVTRMTIPVWSSDGEAQMSFTLTCEMLGTGMRDRTRIGTR